MTCRLANIGTDHTLVSVEMFAKVLLMVDLGLSLICFKGSVKKKEVRVKLLCALEVPRFPVDYMPSERGLGKYDWLKLRC